MEHGEQSVSLSHLIACVLMEQHTHMKEHLCATTLLLILVCLMILFFRFDHDILLSVRPGKRVGGAWDSP
jgi:hypothetical protein